MADDQANNFQNCRSFGAEKSDMTQTIHAGNIIGEGDQSGHIRGRKEVVNFGNECKKLEVDTATSSHVQCIIIKIITPRSTFITTLHLMIITGCHANTELTPCNRIFIFSYFLIAGFFM